MKKSDLSTKDLSYLADIFNWNVNAYNLCCHFSSLVDSSDAQKLINELEKKHYQVCKTILGLMK